MRGLCSGLALLAVSGLFAASPASAERLAPQDLPGFVLGYQAANDQQAEYQQLMAERILLFHREIRQLKELVPLCMYCKKVRTDEKYWQNVESYIQSETGVGVTHSLCPDCNSSIVQPQLDELRRELGHRVHQRES